MTRKLDTWGEKFMREQPFMAFGSLMNAYANMHQREPVELKKFKEDAQELFALAQELATKAYGDAQPEESEDIDLPVVAKPNTLV